MNLFSAKEDYLKVLLGTYGCVHFQDRLKTEFVEKKGSILLWKKKERS